MKFKKAILLVNLGTPDSPSVKDVKKYLTEFLNDNRVIDIPWLLRKLLVNFIIIPFRVSNSAKIYKKLWTKEGSPLLLHGLKLEKKIQEKLQNKADIYFAMRYQNPNIKVVLEKIRKKNYKKIIILPLYPHYASSSTGSTLEKVMKIVQKWFVIPEIQFVSQYYDEQGYIDTIVQQAQKKNIFEYDYFLFSYHGLPISQVDKVYNDGKPCADHNCENEITYDNQFCYKAICYETTRRIAEKLNIPKEKYIVGFQSRLNKKWIEPFSDKIIIEKAQSGIKKILVFSPSFVADCLETTIEINEEYKELFIKNGGEQLDLVESLNTHPTWVNTLEKMIIERL